jgi:LmbE family N-acetylglucosaminyl deacetylase
MPTVLLVFAHPENATIALGARIARFRDAHYILVTDGAPRSEMDSLTHGFSSWKEYRDARARELTAMLRLAGLGHMSRECFAIPDQQACFRLAELTRWLAQRIQDIQPEIVLTHPYEGGHPDHDACAFAVHHACALAHCAEKSQPVIVEGAFYHAGPDVIETEAFLPAPTPVSETVRPLTPREQSRKRERMDCFVTQQTTLAQFPCDSERFRIAPDYDFTLPPHPGPTLYDNFSWEMTSGRFCRLAEDASRHLRQEQEASRGR